MTGDPGKLSNLLSIMILIIINGRLFFHVTFFFIWIIQLVPINFEFRKKKQTKNPPKTTTRTTRKMTKQNSLHTLFFGER